MLSLAVMLGAGFGLSSLSGGQYLIVVPGRALGSFELGNKEETFLRIYPDPTDTGSPGREAGRLFAAVFKESLDSDVLFDEFFHYRQKEITVFCMNRILVAVISANSSLYLENGESLRRGLDYVLYVYGNEGLSVVKKDSHSLYLYAERGVAFFDDGSDGFIDMVAIFSPMRQKP
jgi:hypothetical protein